MLVKVDCKMRPSGGDSTASRRTTSRRAPLAERRLLPSASPRGAYDPPTLRQRPNPHARSRFARPHLDQVADLVDDPQTTPAVGAWRGQAPTGERIRDEAGVIDLADDLTGWRPHTKKARRARVLDRVRHKLVDRHDEIVCPLPVHPDRSGTIPDHV